MKKKLLTIILTISCFLAFGLSVNAVPAKNSTGTVYDLPTITNKYNLKTGYYAKATFGNTDAFCMDPGKNPVKNGVDCPASVYDNNNDFAKAAKYIFSQKANDSQTGAAIRIVSIATGAGEFGKNENNNSICGYIAAAYKAANGTKFASMLESKYKNYKSDGNLKCLGGYDVQGEVISFAAKALQAATKNVSTGTAPTAQIISNKNGVTTFKVDNSKGNSEVKVEITCTGATGEGCGKVTTIASKDSKTFTIKTNTNNEEQCGSFTAKMTYQGGNDDGACKEITKYNCGSLQDYAGCSKMDSNGSNNNGNNKEVVKYIKEDGSIVDDSTPIPIKCDDTKKKVCNVTQKPSVNTMSGDEGNGLCTGSGATVISINEASTYTSTKEDIENCVIDNQEFLVDKSQSGICATYCVEDYKFYHDETTNGLLLSDKDKDGNDFVITSGSYFNFKNAIAKETGNVKCYTKVDMKAFGKSVEKAAQNYADSLANTTHTCEQTTDESGNAIWKMTTTKNSYIASYSNTTHAVTYTANNDVKVTTHSEKPSACGTTDHNYTGEEMGTFKKTVENLTKEIEKCVSDAKKYKANDECHSEVKFDYGYNMDPVTIPAKNIKNESSINEYSNCNGDLSSTSCRNGASNVKVQLDTEKFVEFNTVEYVENNINVEYEYDFSGMGICNDYNKQEIKYGFDVTEENCNGDGNTFVKGWPISYDTPAGIYKYQITVSGYGHIGKDGQCYGLDKYGKDKTSYGCEYKVNCKDCPFECDPTSALCEPKDNEKCKGDCPWECAGMGCISDPNSGLALDYQAISLINIDSSIGYLSDKYEGVAALSAGRNVTEAKASKLATVGTGNTRNVKSINWGTIKGQATLNSIDSKGEGIYSGTPEYSVTLKPSDIRDIKKYNNENNKNYLDNSLKCTNNAVHKEYVTCTSEYLDKLQEAGILKVRNNDFISAYDIPAELIPSGQSVNPDAKSLTGPAWK